MHLAQAFGPSIWPRQLADAFGTLEQANWLASQDQIVTYRLRDTPPESQWQSPLLNIQAAATRTSTKSPFTGIKH